MKKYEIIKNEYIEHNGVILYRIRALKNFGEVRAGDLGGYIQNESNLSHHGECWVRNFAKVYGNAKVRGNALVYGRAEVYENATVIDEAHVGFRAKVHGNAKIWNRSNVVDNAEVWEEAWIRGSGTVSGNARVHGHAVVYGIVDDCAEVSGLTVIYEYANIGGNSIVWNKYDYILITPIGSNGRSMTIVPGSDFIRVGCFTGTKKEFLEAVRKKHGDNKYGRLYRDIIESVYANM